MAHTSTLALLQSIPKKPTVRNPKILWLFLRRYGIIWGVNFRLRGGTEILPRRNLRMIDIPAGVTYTDATGSKGGRIWHLVNSWRRYGAATA